MIRVRATGSLSSTILVVGEAADLDAIHAGAPFGGSTWWELRHQLDDSGIGMMRCRITLACPYFPPGGYVSSWIKDEVEAPFYVHKFQEKFVSAQIAEGIRDLEGEIQRLKPNVIIALGEFALWVLTGKKGIGNHRGSILPCTLVPGFKVVPTYRPSYVFKAYDERIDVIADLGRALNESRYPEIRKPGWVFHLAPSLTEALDFIKGMPREVICDIETGKKQIKCVGLGISKKEAMCIPITRNGSPEGYWSAADEALIVHTMMTELKKRDVINQNFLYDAFYFSWLWGHEIIPVFDTMIAQGVIFPGKPKSLDYLASIHCDYYEYWKHDKKDWTGYTSDNDLWYYNCQDDVYTWEVWESLDRAIDDLGFRKQFNFVMSQFAPIHRMMLRGVNSGPLNRAQLSKDLEVAVKSRWGKLAGIFGHKVNPNSPKQMAKLFYTDLGQPEIKKRGKDSLTCDDDALATIAMREPILAPVTKLISEARSLRLVKSNFVDIETPDGRIYTAFNPVGTITFRYNSTSNPLGYGTNAQNVIKIEDDDPDAYPADMPNVRGLFLPDPGYTLVEFDLAKADLRVVCWEADEPELKALLKAGRNIYKEVGSDVTGMPYRQAKSFIHGTDYGGSARTMARNTGITVHAAELAQNRWFGAYPGIKRWHRRVENLLKSKKIAENKFNYRIMFFDRVDGLLPEALAWTPQSTVALVINTIVRRIFDKYETVFDDDVQLLLQVHDSVLTQIRTERLGMHIYLINKMFSEIVVPYDDPLVIPCDCKVSEVSWAQMVKYAVNPALTTHS
ncbi:MAG TPA: DNA polymerase [Nitrospiraceae bacterium]